jgi:thiol-disulfide isomerase/thioredoxin
MIQFPLRFAALLACLLLAGIAGIATTAHASETNSDKPTLVKIHANWCGACARTEGTWTQLKETYGDSANFVIFDVTDKEALQKSQAEAKRLGLTTILDEYKSSTGTIAVVGANGETLGVFKGVSDAESYDEAIGQACTS